MMNEPALPSDQAVQEGERFAAQLSITWLSPGPIEAGETIAPARVTTPRARAYAALHLSLRDIEFAHSCLSQANALGIPHIEDVQSRALICAGVVAYARPFKTGVRERLDPDSIASALSAFDRTIHDYLIALRDKHVAHSVNAFETGEPIAVMIGTPGGAWRDGSGVGVAITQTIGITGALVRQALSHMERLRDHINAELERQQAGVYADFKDALAKDGKWEMAPMVTLADRARIAERRS